MKQASSVERRHLLMALAGAAFGAAGCSASTCDTSAPANPPSDFREGTLHTLASGDKVYESSAPDGQFLNFSAGSRYRIFHQLGGRPMGVEAWVSFSATGTSGGNMAPAAGNMAEVTEVTDECFLIRNNSCADYWLRVVAHSPAPASGSSCSTGSEG